MRDKRRQKLWAASALSDGLQAWPANARSLLSQSRGTMDSATTSSIPKHEGSAQGERLEEQPSNSQQ